MDALFREVTLCEGPRAWGIGVKLVHYTQRPCTKGLVINYGEGGGYKMEKSRVETFCAPPPQDRVKHFCAPPPITMAKTSSSRVKTTSKLVVPPPPFSRAKTFSAPPPFHRGKTSHPPPSRFVPPPPPPSPRN